MKTFFFSAFVLASGFPAFSQVMTEVAPAQVVSGSVSPVYSPLESLYDVTFYFINIEANDSTDTIRATTSVHFTALSEIDTLVFELSSTEVVDSVVLNGVKQDRYLQEDELLKIIPATPIDPGTANQAVIRYAGTGSSRGFFAGLSNGHDYVYNQHVTYTLSEPYEAKDWFPVKQNLQDKADSVWVFITTPEGQMAGSNGLLTRVSKPGPGKVRYEWKSRYPTDFYLISFTVANYQDYSFYAVDDVLGDSLLVQNFIYNTPDILPAQKANIDITGDFIIYYSRLLGQYPFIREKYGHCMAPIGGGMEHQTMTTLQNFNFTLVSHELFHQWFGDHVTCGSWRDIWVNEGFASYGEYLALEKFKGHAEALAWMSDAHDRALISPDMAVYLTEDETKDPGRIFDYNITYKKGASIIHMLRYEMDNDSLFFGILRRYQQKYAYSTALASDFINLVNDLSGQDYSWFFDQWYYGTGYPVFETSWTQKEDSLLLDSYQVQVNSASKLFKTHMNFQVNFEDGSHRIYRVWYDALHEHFALPVDQKVTTVIADPDLDLLMKSSIYRATGNTVYELSPNPFTRDLEVTFTNPLPGRNIYITNTQGQLVYQHPAESEQVKLDLAGLEQGLFLLVILTPGGKKYTSKIVKVEGN